MPSPTLLAAFDAANARHRAAVAELVPLLVAMTLATVAEVLPGAAVLETVGEMNEDWVFTLRIQRVRDRDGIVLYDVSAADDDPAVEQRLDEVGVEFLDPLLHITGEDYFGRATVARPGEGHP